MFYKFDSIFIFKINLHKQTFFKKKYKSIKNPIFIQITTINSQLHFQLTKKILNLPQTIIINITYNYKKNQNISKTIF